MNYAIKLALAAAMSVTALSGAAVAQTTNSTNTTTSTPLRGGDATEGFTIVYFDDLNNDTDRQQYTRLEQIMADDAAMAKAQADIAANPAIVAELQERSIELQNVIDVQTAADGSMIVYVR